MKLNTKKVHALMNEQRMNQEMLCEKTGLTRKSLEWIFNQGDVSVDALERISDALGVPAKSISKEDDGMNAENTIEFRKDASVATVTFTKNRYISRVQKLEEKRPEECQIINENKDGSIVAHIPVSWIKINPKREVTEEERQKRAEMIRQNIFDKSNYR